MGEFSIGGILFVTSNLAVRFGYDVLAIGDIALASENFTRSVDPLYHPNCTIHHRSRVTYYSPSIAAMLTY